MTGPLPVLLALGGAPCEEPLIAAIERMPDRVRIVRRCLDLTDLLAAAAAGTARLAVVAEGLPRLDAEAVTRLAAAGVRVLAVAEQAEAAAADAASFDRLRALGADVVLTPSEAVEGAGLLAGLAAAMSGSGGALEAGPTGDPGGDPAVGPRSSGASVAADPEGGSGRVLAVWGPVGAPGRTAVAVTLADELARLGIETLLADADTYGPSVAQRLGLLDEGSGLAAAARAANAGLLDAATLAGCARALRPRLRVLTGLNRPDRWPELGGGPLATVWRSATRLVERVVVDCGFCLEEDEEISFDTAAPRRNATTLSALAGADVVVAVGSADPVGLARLIRTLPEVRRRSGPAQLRVVVNQVRRGAVGRNPQRRIADELRRHAGITAATFVPQDREALDAAALAGRSLGEVARSSPARVALAALAAELG